MFSLHVQRIVPPCVMVKRVRREEQIQGEQRRVVFIFMCAWLLGACTGALGILSSARVADPRTGRGGCWINNNYEDRKL